MKLLTIVALACLMVPVAFADEETKGVSYKYQGATFMVYPPENGEMRIAHPDLTDLMTSVRVDAARDRFEPGVSGTAKEALDDACQSLLDIIENQKKGEQNRPHLEKALQEFYEELAEDSKA